MKRAWLFHVLILLSIIHSSTPASVATQNLLGCGAITRPSRIYPYSPANYDSNGNTPDVCMQACSSAGFAYASVSGGGLCLCGTSSANISLLNSTSTTLCQALLCTGDANLYCGDLDYELVYSAIGLIDSVSISLSSMGSPMALTVNQLYQFTLGYQGAVSQINYQIDFGDGTKTGWFPGILNSTTTVSHVFTRTGQFAISVAARSISAMKPAVSAMAVKVIDQVSASDVALTCPNVTATLKTVSCTLTSVRGTDLTAQLTYNTTTPTNMINHIPNAPYYAFGSASVTYYPTVDPSAVSLTTSDIAILPQSTFTAAGRITSIQFYTSGAGPGTIYLLRRVCTLPQMYCYSSNACGSCTSPYALTCSSNQYSTGTQDCVNATSTSRFQASAYHGVQFQIVAQWSYSSSGAQYNQIVANSSSTMINTTAMVGDFLGFQGTNMAKEQSLDGSMDYRCVNPIVSGSMFTCTVANISLNSSTYRYLLQATVVQPVQMAPIVMYYDAGNFNIQGTITQRNVSSFTVSTILPVVYGIDSVEILGPASASINVMSRFTARLSPINATGDIYIWSINGNITANTSSNTFNVSFSQTGTYTIGCLAQNLLSMRSNTTTIIIQDIITNFSLHAGNISNVSTSQPMEIAQFELRMATGSNYVCRVNFDTTQSTTQVYFYTYGFIPGSFLTYRYTQPGAYNVNATCENGVNNASYAFTHYVQHPILGLQLQQRGAIRSSTYRLNFTIAQGTSPQFRILFNGTQVGYTYYEQFGLIQTDPLSDQSGASNYTVEIYAWNFLSSVYLLDTFSVQSPIVNPEIRASTTNTVFPGPIAFEYTMQSGSDVNVVFSFGDTLIDSPVRCPHAGEFPANQWASCSGTNRTFLIPGTITVIVAFSNAISTIYKYLTVILITPVSPIEVRTTLQLPSRPCSAAFVDSRAIASFVIQGQNNTVKPAANAQVMVFPDIINQPTLSRGPFQLTMNYFAAPAATTNGLNVMYRAPGNYTARFEVRNSIDAVNISCVVQVTSILQQVFYSLTPRHWPLNSPTPFQASVFIGDPNPGPVSITWSFGDGTVVSGPRNATDFNQADTRSHFYTALGTYTLTITVQGPNNIVTRNFSVVVENPVRNFTVTLPGFATPSQISFANSPVTVRFSIQDISIPAASNAQLLIDYNDTTPLAMNSVVNTTLPFNGTYTFTSPGIFRVNVTVYNQVSSVTQIVLIGINAPFNNFAARMCYLLPGLINPLDETCDVPFSAGTYYVPKQSQLVLYASWTNPSGIPSLFEVQFRSGATLVFTQSLTSSQVMNISQLTGSNSGAPLFRLVINLETNALLPDGLYSVSVISRNPSFNAASSLNIYIMSSIAGLSINDNNILVGMNTDKTFYASYEYFSVISCLYIQYSDDAVECYGLASVCQTLPSDIPSSLPSCPLPIRGFSFNSSSVIFARSFNSSQAWLTGYAWNSITAVTARAFFSFPLSTSDCGLPRIEFDIAAPLIRLARRIQRSRAFSIAARTVLNCSQSLNNTKQWRILQCDTTTEQCAPTPALDQFTDQLASAKAAEINIRARGLPLGTYLFNYSVTMTSMDGFSTFAYTYIRIVPSDIKVNLLANGTSFITNGITQSLLFQPGVYSIDPDFSYFDPQEWTFDYYCRIYGLASYPIVNGQELTIESTTVDPVNPSCFDSPGNTSYFKYGPNNNRSILYIQPRALQSLRSYEFKAVITNIIDPSRVYMGFALVQIQDMDSVLISVECIIRMCSPDLEYQRINPTTQAALKSDCLQCGDATEMIIEWSVYRGFQSGYPNNDIQWILLNNMSAFDDILFYGRMSKNFTATSELFLRNPSILYWKFQSTYIVTTPNGVAMGTGAIRFQINSPPTNGNCTVDRNNGTTTTLFTFTCVNWYDEDGIQDYTFYAFPLINGSRIPIGFTRLPQFQVFLPRGDPNAQYALPLTVQIRDVLGAIQTIDLPPVIVQQDDSSISDFIRLSQQSDTQGQGLASIEQILYAGDQNFASQVILSLSQALNSMSSDLLQNATTGDIPTQSVSVSGLLDSNSGSSTLNTSVNNTEALAAYNTYLNSQANVRDYAIQFLNNLTVTTIDSIKLQASTISELTSVPTELTRQATAYASSKCESLINSLNEMVDTVSYEDVRMAVDSVAQLASNILVAINAPLLGRGMTLNLDYDRANMLPPDYETDIETVWANPNNFAEGDDFSLETIERNRNKYYQQQGSNQAVGQVDTILSKTVNVLSYHMNTGQENLIVTPSISMLTRKLPSDNLSSLVIDQAGGAQFELPRLSFCDQARQMQSCSNDTPITVNSIVVPLATAGNNGQNDAAVNMSRSVTLTLSDTFGTTIPVRSLPSPIRILIPRDPSLQLPPMTFQNATQMSAASASNNNNNRQFALYHVSVTGQKENVTVSATFELKSDDPTLAFMLIYRFDGIPILNSTLNQTDGSQVLCPGDQVFTQSDGLLYSFFLDNIQTKNRQYVMFGVRELNSNESTQYCPRPLGSSQTQPITDRLVNFTTNYWIRTYTSGCYYFDEKNNWRSDGLRVGPGTNHEVTECFSNHLTTFAGGWIVLPAPINWNYVFANADFLRNKTIYITLIVLVVLYILLMIYARYKDKKDVEKLGVTPLPDNLANDKYYYQIIVFTGLRKDAGTTSKVHFIVAGEDDETGTRTFEDPKRKILQRGAIDSFIMAVPKSLGRLNYMRVWHDNSGSGNNASWFLKYIVVRDLQTMEKSYFICQQWFAVEKDDGAIDRLLPVAGELQKTEFAYLLSKKTYHSFSDGHLWFSVFSRPPSTRFTRTQRCTCCFVLLFMSMLMNIMYYDQAKEAKSRTGGGISLGPFFVTPEQIGIGVIVELICFLPSTILVELFRRLRPRRPPKSPVREALRKIQEDQLRKQQQQTVLSDIHPQLTNYVVNSDPIVSQRDLDQMRKTLASPLPNSSGHQPSSDEKSTTSKRKKKRVTFPWWFIFIAYGLAFAIFAISAFFIFARGVEFGDTKVGQWLTSSVAGFFSSILLTQPLKVLLLAIFFALIIRRDDDDEVIANDDDDIFLDGDEEYLHSFEDKSLLTFRTKSGHAPLTAGEIAYARDRRVKQIRMWEIIRELIAYASFLWILYVVSYSNRDPNAFHLMKHLKSDLLNLHNETENFNRIYRMNQFWDWLNTSFLPRIRASHWYNGAVPTNLSGYIGDKTNRILGWPTMRQLRVKPESCTILSSFKSIIPSCEAGYNILNEDQRSFYPGWTSLFNESQGYLSNYSSAINKAFVYSDSDHLDTYTYIGEHATYGDGGYVYEFRGPMAQMISNITRLKELSWLDMHTRAVMIQMSLYNPNVNLFIFVTILVEFIPTGAAYPSARVEPLSLLNYYQGFALFKLICSIVYMLFIIYYMQREIRAMFTRRLAYFRDFWSYPEMGIIICSWTGFGVYLWRAREGDRIGDLFKETNGYAYVNLQLATYVNDLLTFLLGFCCFFGTIKFLRLLRFNQRMSMLSSTLAHAAKDLISFTAMFSIVYLGYLALFFLLFHSKIWACSDALKTAQMLFEMMLLKFDVSDLYAADIFLGPFCFTLFVIFVVFICMNMFISIISDSFRVVRHNISLQQSEHEIIDFTINQFKKWTGLGKTQEMDRLHLNPYDGTHVQYHDPVTSFPTKMDELISALDKIYLDTAHRDKLMLRPGENEEKAGGSKTKKGILKLKK